MVEIVQSPANESRLDIIKIFLAGGISNCPNWQKDLCDRFLNDERLQYKDVIVFSPRCEEIPEEDPQVRWEYDKLNKSDIIGFWFSYGSLNPITLFEYGSYIRWHSWPLHYPQDKINKTLVVGCHSDYQRKNNVIIQTKLARPGLEIQNNLDDFYNKLIETILNYKLE